MKITDPFSLLLYLIPLACFITNISAFGAGNIASISRIEGHAFRHGDIEDTLKQLPFLKGHKWDSLNIKRAYLGNFLRDYSQAIDIGTLKGAQASSIRILVWKLTFLTFGYATAEFEVTDERLGVYRPEEHIDNPKGYGGGEDPRKYDPRLRGPIDEQELAIDPETGMANYIANERGNWSTSIGYIKWSFARSLHFGRTYTHGANKGREEDLCEALRCLGQGMHTLEDMWNQFPKDAIADDKHISQRIVSYNDVFPLVGSATGINLRGKHVFPLVTGTFGSLDFVLSVIGEASDHVTQSEVDELDTALGNASKAGQSGKITGLTGLLSQVPGTRDLCQQAEGLQAESEAQAARNDQGSSQGERAWSTSDITNLAKTDPQAVIDKIYPILAFRDKVVRAINNIISKIPGLESLVEKITETVTLFVLRLLAPYIRPLIALASSGLKQGTTGIVGADASQQYAVFDDPHSIAPTHSMLSKDHFSGLLNEPAGNVATTIISYVAPRIMYGWDHPEVPEHEIMNDIAQVLHHPAIRNERSEVQSKMFDAVASWAQEQQRKGVNLNQRLNVASVRRGHNHSAEQMPPQGFAAWTNIPNLLAGQQREVQLEDGSGAPSLPSRPQINESDVYGQQSQGQAPAYSQQEYQQPPYQGGYEQQQSQQQAYNQAQGYPSQQQGYPAAPQQYATQGYPSQQQAYQQDPWANDGRNYQGAYQGQPPPDAYGAQQPTQQGYGGYNAYPPQQGPPPGSGQGW